MYTTLRPRKLAALCAFFALGAALLVAGPMPAAAQDMTIRLTAEDVGKPNSSQRIVVPFGKSKIVELPVDARDVLVSNPAIADANVRTPRLVYIMANAIGQTNAFFFDNDGNRILNLEISVEQDLAPLRSLMRQYMPDSRIQVSSLNDTIVLNGTVANAAQAERARRLAEQFVLDPSQKEDRVVSMLTIEGGELVLLKVRVVEMQRTVSKQLRFDNQHLVRFGEATAAILTDSPFSLNGAPLSNTLFNLNWTDSDSDQARMLVNALERVGMVRILAEPNLTSVSCEPANFLVGGEFPVPTGRDNNGNITIVFKPFGIGLAFTPVVLSDGLISLKISTEVSELSQEGGFSLGGTVFVDEDGNLVQSQALTVPGITVRRAETVIELPSGGSMAIAGLLQDTLQQNLDALPGLKNVPILGALARSRDFQSNQTELVVMVTPFLVGATGQKDLVMPDKGFVPASDAQTILLGRLNTKYGNGQPPQNRTFKGPAGFIVE